MTEYYSFVENDDVKRGNYKSNQIEHKCFEEELKEWRWPDFAISMESYANGHALMISITIRIYLLAKKLVNVSCALVIALHLLALLFFT